MLVLTRGLEETIVIDGNIRVTVLRLQGDRVRLGIEAPACVRVDREEIHVRQCAAAAENLELTSLAACC